MKLTGNISIESIIHVVRIDLLTSHVPRTEIRGQKVDQTNGKRTASSSRPCPAGYLASNG